MLQRVKQSIHTYTRRLLGLGALVSLDQQPGVFLRFRRSIECAASVVRSIRFQREPCILILRLDEIGDLILTSGMIREIRRVFPLSHIDLVVRPPGYELARQCSHVSRVLVFDPPPLGDSTSIRARNRYLVAFALKRLFWRGYTLAISPRWDIDGNLAGPLALLSGAKKRIGYGEAVSGAKAIANSGYNYFYTDVCHATEERHEVERCYDLLRFAGINPINESLEPWVSATTNLAAEKWLTCNGYKLGAPFIIYAPFSRQPVRDWPTENYVELSQLIHRSSNIPAIVIGDHTKAKQCKTLAAKMSHYTQSAAAEISLDVVAALISKATIVVGSDSAPVHLAASVGVPSVVISCHSVDGDPRHSNAPERFKPWSAKAAVVRPPRPMSPCVSFCGEDAAHCIKNVRPEAVLRYVNLVLSEYIERQ